VNHAATTLSDIAKVLHLISEQPNLRPDPSGDFGVYLFDGGKKRIVTGVTSYEFDDGAKACSGTMPYINFFITFPDGLTVSIGHQDFK
jgi:hypothetical protein